MRLRLTLHAAMLALASVRAAAQAPIASAATMKPAPATKSDEPLYKLVLDYDVPASPGFTVIGVTPEKVLRGASAKPLVASLLNSIASGGKVKNGVALDVIPYLLYGRAPLSIAAYDASRLTQILTHAQLSVASVQSAQDTSSTTFGLGVRLNLLDPHDLLRDTTLLKPVFYALNMCAGNAPAPAQLNDAPLKPVHCDRLAESYAAAAKLAQSKRGMSLSIGGGIGGRLLNGIASRDSLTDRVGRFWASAGYMFGAGAELQATVALKDTAQQRTSARGGLAVRAKYPKVQLGFETVYDGDAHTLQPGGALEWRLAPGIWIVNNLGTETVERDGNTASKLRLRSSLRWNALSLQP